MEKQNVRPSPDALLNPRYDANFKAIFSDDSEEGRLALTSFLQAVLNAEVSDIQLIQSELPIEAVYDKQSVFDISCTLDGRRHVNIEMQGINIDNALVSFGSAANKTEGGSQGVKIEQSLYLPPLRTS